MFDVMFASRELFFNAPPKNMQIPIELSSFESKMRYGLCCITLASKKKPIKRLTVCFLSFNFILMINTRFDNKKTPHVSLKSTSPPMWPTACDLG